MGKIVINSVAELDTLRQIAFYTFIIKRCWGAKAPDFDGYIDGGKNPACSNLRIFSRLKSMLGCT